MNNSPESTPGLLALVRAKAAACAAEAALACAKGDEWHRQAREWSDFAEALQHDDPLPPLVPLPPRRRF